MAKTTKKKKCTDVKSPASKAGQIIGEAFEHAVIAYLKNYINTSYVEYMLLEPEEGGKLTTLEMIGGLSRQMDNVIVTRNSNEPIALMETKWLKDARHHNDKGAWILQLREVKKKYATVRGATAILAGYWTSGVGIMLMNEGGVKMVLVATDTDVYSSLQPHIDSYFGENNFTLDAEMMRQSYVRPADFLKVLCHLLERDEINEIARTWLFFDRIDDITHQSHKGFELINRAIDELLSPLPELQNVNVNKLKISLEINTGNVIYQEFDDIEEAQDFIQRYMNNPDEILKRISPNTNHDEE